MDFLTHEILKIIKLEQSGASWSEIATKSDSLLEFIHLQGLADSVNELIYQYLEDYDARQMDSTYAEFQINNVLETLNLT